MIDPPTQPRPEPTGTYEKPITNRSLKAMTSKERRTPIAHMRPETRTLFAKLEASTASHEIAAALRDLSGERGAVGGDRDVDPRQRLERALDAIRFIADLSVIDVANEPRESTRPVPAHT